MNIEKYGRCVVHKNSKGIAVPVMSLRGIDILTFKLKELYGSLRPGIHVEKLCCKIMDFDGPPVDEYGEKTRYVLCPVVWWDKSSDKEVESKKLYVLGDTDRHVSSLREKTDYVRSMLGLHRREVVAIQNEQRQREREAYSEMCGLNFSCEW